MKNFSLNRKLGVLAFTLAFVGLLFDFISPEGKNQINESPNYISVVSLAEKIKNRESVRVIDLRSKELFEEFHIPTADHLPLERWLDQNEISDDLLVFYSGDDPLCRQLWRGLPQSVQQRSVILYGGIHDWYERLLYPKLPIKYDRGDSAIFHKVHDLSLFYGGQAEFVEDKEVMKYYQQDFDKLKWQKSHRQNGLVRKGC